VLHQQAVVRLDDVIPKGREEICLQGDLEQRGMVGIVWMAFGARSIKG
jgi:hypothetical protein